MGGGGAPPRTTHASSQSPGLSGETGDLWRLKWTQRLNGIRSVLLLSEAVAVVYPEALFLVESSVALPYVATIKSP